MDLTISTRSRTVFVGVFFTLTIAGLILYLMHVQTGLSLDRVMMRPFKLFAVYWSGVGLLISFGVGYGIAKTQPAFGIGDTHVQKFRRPLTVLLLGWLGARLFDVVFVSPVAQAQGIRSAADFFANPIFLFDLNWGGLNVWGALYVVGIWLLWFLWSKNLPIVPIFFKAITGFLAGLSLIQWGHFMTQELYGYPWSGWGSLVIDSAYRVPQFVNESNYVPMFLFAAVWYFLGAICLLFGPRWQVSWRGQALGILAGLAWFVAGRLFIELATPNSLVNWLPAMLLLAIIFGLALLLNRQLSNS